MSRKTTYKYYDDQFKAPAVALGELTGAKAMDVAVVLGIHPVMLYRWKQELRGRKDNEAVSQRDPGYRNETGVKASEED